MIEERVGSLRHRNRLTNPRSMGISRLKHIAAIVLQQDIFAIIDVALRLAVGDFLNPTAKPIIPVRARERGRGIARHKVFHLRQPILGIIRVLRVVAGGEERLARQVAVVVVLVATRRIGGELIPGIRRIPCRRAIAHRIVGEALRRPRQRMARTREPVQRVVAKGLAATAIRQARSIPHAVVEIVGFVDRRAAGGELVENVRHLRRGIIA